MTLELLIGGLAILFSVWILAQDPTIQTYRRRVRLDSALKPPSENKFPDDLVAVLPSDHAKIAQRSKRRRRFSG